MSDASPLPALPPAAGGLRLGSAVLRALFLASSWTWVIGMLLPVYLVEDFGWPGWVAFAVPNCLGAMLVGLVFARPGSSERFLRAHAGAARWFSLITILFHASVLAWFIGAFAANLSGRPAFGAAAGVFVSGFAVGAAALAGRWGMPRADGTAHRPLLWAGAAVYAFSLACAGVLLARGLGDDQPLARPNKLGFATLSDFRALIWVAPALAIGFLACPHLDLTFHRTRREVPGPTGTAAFIIAFLILFPALILFSLLYAKNLRSGVSVFIVAHILAQSWFTMSAHFRELHEAGWTGPRPGLDSGRLTRLLLKGAMVATIAASALLVFAPARHDGLSASRFAYDTFLGFYAFVFPLYLWTVAVDRAVPRRRALAAWAVLCVLVAPMFIVGQMVQVYPWLLAAAGVMLVMPPLLALVLMDLGDEADGAPGDTPGAPAGGG
ncbi:MAG: hypothetical protein IBJ11_04755 [Phycisphaerales bacterium]|nr:hypothetical protein [Phycisphaerales bacterium]